MTFYAHTTEDGSPWEPLFTPGCPTLTRDHCEKCARLERDHGHLNKVAYLCSKFAAEMFPPGPDREAARQWGRLAGLWHDLGKFAPAWQAYLKTKADPHQAEVAGTVDHSTGGAQYSHQHLPHFGTLFSYLIAGHHAGLADGIDPTDSNLTKRLNKTVAPYLEKCPLELLNFVSALPPIPFALRSPLALGYFIRFLFSTLVDADFLATEAFMNAKRQAERPQNQPPFIDLETTLNTHLEALTAQAKPTAVNHTRAHVLQHCLSAAERPPGLFSLTVPTGGGKTLSSLAFALRHARIHDLRRVIYVIPFTSIIEQNAAVFRKALAALGPDIVLEHHSNLDPDSAHETNTNRLACENWDARIIVTTNVQFLESLHANRTSRCRKLHRIARSVVILDEAQTLPVEFLAPCLRSLEELHRNYGATIVLCTATQPAIHRRDDFNIGLDSPHEIIPDPATLYSSLQRVCAHQISGKMSNPTLAERIKGHSQVLVIVNTRRHARELFEELPDDGTRFHLSALMCPAHRRVILYLIQRRLRENLPVRLVSTQLIEAGVDIDFPVVFRSLAGLDSIAQAAGRCDREGRLTARLGKPGGNLYLFESADYKTPSFVRSAANATTQILAVDATDPLGLAAIKDYFQRHYWDRRDATDQKHILDNVPQNFERPNDLFNFKFKTTARDFKLIDDYTEPVLIPFGQKGRKLCDQLRATYDPAAIRHLARKLQSYTVNIPQAQHLAMRSKTLLSVHDGRFHVLNSDTHYDNRLGLIPEIHLTFSPAQYHVG